MSPSTARTAAIGKRLVDAASNLWTIVKRRRYLCLLLLVVIFIFSALSILRHMHFTSSAYDLAIFDQAVWQYSEFHPPMSSVRSNVLTENLLGDHFHPILVLLAPLYWITDGVEALLIAQAALFALALIPIFLFTEKRLGTFAAYAFSIAYSIFWGIQNAVEFDFHEIAFAVPLIAFAIYFMDEERWTPFFVSLALLLLTKENLAVSVFFFGVYLCATRRFRQGLISMAAGFVWFFAATKVFIPFFAGPARTQSGNAGSFYRYWSFNQFGPNPSSAFVTILKDPLLVIRTLVSPATKLSTYWYLFHPFLFLPFLSPLFILAIPMVAERFLSEGAQFWGTNYHYSAVITPVLVMASVDSLTRITRKLRSIKREFIVIPASVCVLLLNLLLVPKFPLSRLVDWSYWQRSPSDVSGQRAVALIPSGASVVAQGPIAPHLSQRRLIFVMNPFTEIMDCEYIIAAHGLNPFPSPSFKEIDYYVETEQTRGYRKIFDENGWVVLKAGDLVGPPVGPYINAQFVEQEVPASMVAGRTYDVSVSMKNTGVEPWTADRFYRLYLVPRSDVWGIQRVELPSAVPSGAVAKFQFKITAPSKSGTYVFQAGMLQEGVTAIGEPAPALQVTVVPE